MPRKRTKNWIKRINNILSQHRYTYKGTLIKFGATKYPYPAVSIMVFNNGKKLIEWAIPDLLQLIDDLEYAYEILKEVKEEEGYSRRRRRNEDEEEEEEERRTSRRRRRAPERD